MVGAPRFELGTSCAQGRRSNQLSYAPNRLSDDFHVLPVLLRGLPGPSGHRTASRHSPIDSSGSAFTRRILTPECSAIRPILKLANSWQIGFLRDMRIPGDGDQRFRTIVIAIPG